MAMCPKCGGSGRVHADPAVFNAPNMVVCDRCKGSGQVGGKSKAQD